MATTSVDTSGSSLITVKNKRLVAGLFWVPLRKPRKYMAEARELGKKHEMNIVAIRRGPTILQAGFIKKSAGVDKRMYSFAALVADHISGMLAQTSETANSPFVAVFKVEESRYAMVAVKDGSILPGSDSIGDLALIGNRMKEYFQRINDDNAQIYAPEEMDYGGDHTLTLEDVLASIARHHSLRTLNFGGLTNKEAILLGLLAVAIAAGLYAFFDWRVREETRRLILEQQRQEELARIAAESGQEATKQALIHPWTEIPTIQMLLPACSSIFDPAPLSLAGWSFENAQCSAPGVQLIYTRPVGGTLAEFREQASKVWPSAAIGFSLDGANASVALSHRLPPGGDDPLASADQRVETITSRFQFHQVGFAVAQKVSAPVATLPGAEEADQPPPPDWSTAEFNFTAPYPPEALFAGVDTQGMRVLQVGIMRNETVLEWTVKGEIYGH